MRIAEAEILILPGLGNSGPGHWQVRWAEKMSTAAIVEQADWHEPDPDDWADTIVKAVELASRPVVLVAHSLGCIAVARAAARLADGKVRGALLVAPPDLERANLPDELLDFLPICREPLPFPSLLVASSTDPYCALERGADLAAAWGSDFHQAGAAGHINVASGHGPWPEGLLMFTRLMQRL
ncbi:alpha/beta fold hydrolase [Devosia sp. YIM 151766]|uniref:RBBP9/YdeN family alpha/beta hydrolase n=1 Tax=Devosia sp. YIM 151766 TaxID=3017325 RepID=UPI00255CB953|nr:alpha/beta fold hydrolase [Devosia sp. YIM 151766]WIY51605.1 alpha/beta fold hydrolase [Devosia sp. YIM 151766]